MIGRTLDHYRIEEKVGTGGMGEIYRARDQHLHRDVAIKVISPGCLGDQSARRRFRVEALALSKVNHPNIETAFDFHTEDGIDFLVVEYIPGITLKDKIAGGPLPEKEIAHLGLQLADGLCAAHQHGIVHRDLKPGNIMVTPDERLKILDFGLAKLTSPSGPSSEAEHSTTSQAGAGTLAYMAPEQLRGEHVDHRTDIYAVGTILYEAAAGRHPFQGSSFGSLVDQILRYAPVPPSHFRTGLSARLEEIILKCLEKDPENRYQSARELLVDMRRLVGSTDPTAAPLPLARPRQPRRLPWIALAVAAIAASATILWWFWPVPTAPGRPFQVTRGAAWEGQPALAPDGGRIAFVSKDYGNPEISLVDVHGGNPLRLTNDAASNQEPAWFPDGGSIAFASDRGGSWAIWKVGQFGGDATPILGDGREPAISPDGQRIAFARRLNRGYTRIGVAQLTDTSNVQIITGDQDGFWDHEDPAWSPDGQTICYASRHGLWLIAASGGKARPLTTDGELDLTPAWSASGQRIFFASHRAGTLALWSVAPEGGTPERITMGMGPETHPSTSRDGSRLAYSTEALRRSLVSLDLARGTVSVLSDYPSDWMPAFSHDGKWVAVMSSRWGPETDIGLMPIDGGKPAGPMRRLTNQGGVVSHPAFSPDGKWIAYYLILGSERDIWIVPAAGGPPVRFTSHPGLDAQPTWSPDGRRIAFVSDRDGSDQIYICGVEQGRPAGIPVRIDTPGVACDAPVWSPDGRQIAFVSMSKEEPEVYLVDVKGGGGIRKITSGAHALRARWYVTGKELLVSGTWGEDTFSLRSVSAAGGPSRAFTPPVVFGGKEAVAIFDVSSDGRLLVFPQEKSVGNVWVLESRRGAY